MVTQPHDVELGADNSAGANDESCVGLAEALDRWSNLLGRDHVRTDEETIDQYSRTSIPYGNRAIAVVRPGCTAHVSVLVKIATAHRIPLYPISRGKNWGYGAACPTTRNQVILDLSRMNRIVEVNGELAYAVIEPGVSQGKMFDYLREHHPGLMLDVTGAGPEASIVGNTLERGFGHTPYGDHFAHSCGLEVVLADGRVLRTGFGSVPGAKASRVFPSGIGPRLEGLFTQSNFGIVTQMGIWLMPRPPFCQAFAAAIAEDSSLGTLIDALRELRLSDTVRSAVHVANDLRVLSSRQQFPWHLTGGETPLPDAIRRDLRKQAGLGAWNVMGGLYGTRETVAAARTVVHRHLGKLGRLKFFDRSKLARGRKLLRLQGAFGIGKSLEGIIDAAESVFDLLEGIPSPRHLRGVAWRARNVDTSQTIDPCDCGSIWLSPVVPMTGEACRELLSLVEPTFRRYKLEPLITLTSINPRALCCVISICFDKGSKTETDLAQECYEYLFTTLRERGFLPYRVGIQSMEKLRAEPSTYWDVCRQIKAALDPEQILAPGRYCG